MPTASIFVPRVLDLPGLLAKKSHFLLGPRQTGKTTLIRHSLPGTPRYDLLETATWLSLSQNPGRLAEELTPNTAAVVIDEIQRLPQLLNEVHRLIEERGFTSCSPARAPERCGAGGVNLLGGRARTRTLHPLARIELGPRFDLERALTRGTLPFIWFSDDPRADLTAYAGAYLQQEVIFEGAARNLPAFSRFLRVAALSNGQIINFTSVASDAQVPRTTVYEYFEVLRDTLLLFEVPAWRRSPKRKPLVSSKFYFFDIGVANALAGRRPDPGTPEFGHAFEAWLLHELRTYCDYRAPQDLHFLAHGFRLRSGLHPGRPHRDRGKVQAAGLGTGPETAPGAGRGSDPEALSVRQPRAPAPGGGRRRDPALHPLPRGLVGR